MWNVTDYNKYESNWKDPSFDFYIPETFAVLLTFWGWSTIFQGAIMSFPCT